MSATAADVATFFRACEEGKPSSGTDQPPWLEQLAAGAAAELAFDIARARTILEGAASSIPAGQFRNVHALLLLRVAVREAKAENVTAAVERLEALIRSLGDDETPTKARALHLLAIGRMRLGRLDLAEVAISDALALIDDGPVRVWMTDTMAQLLIGQGAWSEAIRTLIALVARRRESHDALGVAISAGHLARLHIQLGRAAEGHAIAREALDGLPADAPVLSRLRLTTLITSALLDFADANAIEAAAVELERLVGVAASDTHYLRGYAMMTLARARAAVQDEPGAHKWLEKAGTELTLPAHLALLRYQEAKIDPRVTRTPEWRASLEKLIASIDFVSEAEVKTLVLTSKHAAEDGDEPRMRASLAAADRRAMQSNNPLWMKWVDEATAELDPEQLSERVALRFSGRSRSELQRTTREECTIIFADLVNFTPRTLELQPEEVMDTVRGLFELGVPLLSKHRVTPISYMGDGLLAICQGEEHQRRGVSFARDLVARAGRVTRVRRTLGNGWPLDLRAGVASGAVVLGTLGTLFKTEFAAIGVATNLAARLQSKAEPGEVMCCAKTTRAAKFDFPEEELTLKGFEKWNPFHACRLKVYTPEPWA